MKKIKTSKTFTLSKYDCGRHHFDPKGEGNVSFVESFSPLFGMVLKLFRLGVPLGSKIEVTMTYKKTKKAKK